ncbi:signal peptide peptidase SppA [Thermodesulfitimonas autotrophica]|uniref:signal peptide peptidase SppA n=1 Tax=Thermodesulfitimonas autotrophica TaxID=1894989 RepID=UPI002FE1EB82
MAKKLIGAFVLGLLIVSVVVAAAVSGGRTPGARGVGGGGKVGVIYIEGIITAGETDGGLFGGRTSGTGGILDALHQAEEDPGVKAVVLRIDSPGGTAAASQEVARAVERVKRAGKKVVTSMADVAASGAYWVAAGSDCIFADPATITGSIGVLIETFEMTGLYGKLGVSKQTIKSGPYKDMGSESRPMTPQERAIFQGMVNDIYAQFVERVATGRKMRREKVLSLADGRVFTGRQAKEVGLVDELGDLRDAVRYAGRLAGIKGEPEVVNLGPSRFPWENLLRGVTGDSSFSSRMLPVWLLGPPLAPERGIIYGGR